MSDPNLPTDKRCNHCGAVAKTRGQMLGREWFCSSPELVEMLWIQCPNCGNVTQPLDLEETPVTN